jgi:membrane protease YdiL (CAAX protease family)
LFFRGLVFTGLLRWGFLPAAVASAGLFTLAHLDAGSIIPFFFVGMTMAWLYWSRGNLWDGIAFHVMFNTTSFLLLLTRV